MTTVDSNKFLRNFIVSGVCGAAAVSIQTFCLGWAHTLLQERSSKGGAYSKLALQIYKKQGLKSFYKGIGRTMIKASLARFGDTATNFMVLDYFASKNQLRKIPLAIQSAATWLIASAWRVTLVPFMMNNEISLKGDPDNLKASSPSSCAKTFKARVINQYKTKAHPQILSLYSWFFVQNYMDTLMPKVTYQQNKNMAFMRYGFIGFCSMITFDLCQIIYRSVKNLKQATCAQNVLLGQGSTRMLMKGCHGIVFCTSSHYLKQTFF